MANYFKIGKTICSKMANSTAKTISKAATKPVASKTSAKLLTGSKANVDLIQRTTLLGAKKSTQLYEYLPQQARENFDTLLSAGKRLGYIKVDKNGRILGKSMERFLTVLDKDAYNRMLFIEQNFKGLDKASFKKLLNAYKTIDDLIANKANVEKWLQVKDELRSYSEAIAKKGKLQAEQAKKDIQEIFGIEPSVRSKGIESIYDKLSRRVLKGKDISSLQAAHESIGDLIGSRIVLEDVSEAGMQKVVDNLCKAIESRKIQVTQIENYMKASSPYFSKSQFEQIRKSAAKIGDEIPVMLHKKTGRAMYTKRSGSGYVTAQMDVKYSNGAHGELQIRGKKMNKYGEIEHIPYDIRQGKNLGKNIPELERFYEPVEDAVTALKRNGLDKCYDDYILNCYKYIRKFESGKIKGPFRLPQFPSRLKGYEILKFESLDKIHVRAEEIKDAYENVAMAA